MRFDSFHLSLMASMNNNNRRTFFPLLLAAIVAACLLPRKAVGRVLGARNGSTAGGVASNADARAAASLIRQAPHTVAYSPKSRRSSGAL